VSVTTLWNAGKLPRINRTYSQITPGRPTAPNALLQSTLVALRLTGGVSGGRTLTMDLSSLSADGSLSQTVSAAQAVRGATMTLSGGQTVNGAVTSVKAPPTTGTLGSSTGSRTLVDSGFTWAAVGSTRTSNVSASSSTGQVVLSSSSSPSRAEVLGSGSGANIALFRVDEDADDRLQLTGTHAFVADAGCGGTCANVTATGYANTAKGVGVYSTTASATASMVSSVGLLPTTFAPLGLIRVRLDSAALSCNVTHSGTSAPVASANIAYTATVWYYAPFDPVSVGGYRSVTVSSTQPVSPLTAALLAQTQVGTDSDGAPLWLSDYFTSWSSMDAPTVASSKTLAPDGTTVETSFSGMLSIQTIPLREGDDSSSVGAAFAPGSCTAEDYR